MGEPIFRLMVQTHTISAPDDLWNKVRDHAEKNGKTISEFTRNSWEEYFEENKKYRIIDLVIILLLSILCVFFIMGVWIL